MYFFHGIQNLLGARRGSNGAERLCEGQTAHRGDGGNESSAKGWTGIRSDEEVRESREMDGLVTGS